MTVTRAHAVSNVGLVRSSNQDSGYAGDRLFLVADGMGGHAGGDVASAIATHHLTILDHAYATPREVEAEATATFVSAAGALADAVAEHPELTGMGTTVSGLVRVDGHVVTMHIGDSRIYLLRDGELSQITNDHTFVQRLVESGRITQEEAAVHPKRSVLMRVLGDVDLDPEIDTSVLDEHPGDRWLLCSDGLSSYVEESRIREILAEGLPTESTTDALLRASLEAGAPDNVTVVLLDVGDEAGIASAPLTVGSASQPLSFAPPPARRQGRIPAMLLHPLRTAPPADAHFEPEADEYLAALIAEDRARLRRRRITAIVLVVLAVATVVTTVVGGYRYTQSQYYIGEVEGKVAIFQGVQADLGPISLSSVYEVTDIRIDSLPYYRRNAVIATISASDLDHARTIVKELQGAAGG